MTASGLTAATETARELTVPPQDLNNFCNKMLFDFSVTWGVYWDWSRYVECNILQQTAGSYQI